MEAVTVRRPRIVEPGACHKATPHTCSEESASLTFTTSLSVPKIPSTHKAHRSTPSITQDDNVLVLGERSEQRAFEFIAHILHQQGQGAELPLEEHNLLAELRMRLHPHARDGLDLLNIIEPGKITTLSNAPYLTKMLHDLSPLVIVYTGQMFQRDCYGNGLSLPDHPGIRETLETYCNETGATLIDLSEQQGIIQSILEAYSRIETYRLREQQKKDVEPKGFWKALDFIKRFSLGRT
ncbi:MAG: hypothetical protein KDD55_09105 [Bdellovibrionales bacterium]|nr:hypothetical protein [Bdellovibrionales bacterium]